MSTWVSAIFRRLADHVGGPDEAMVAGWLRLCERVGPTPAGGPLAHDIVLPRPDRPQLGLNVFGHGARSRDVREQALRFAFTLGDEAGDATARLARELSDATWHGGFSYADGELTLKLYLSASAAVARALRLHDAEAFAYGVDVSAKGLARARSYRRVERVEPDDAMRWPALDRWNRLSEPPGHSHRVLARLADSKRSLDHIFGPEACIDELRELATRVAALDPACASWLSTPLLAELEALARHHGTQLRPVAYEIDLWADGRRGTDALVTCAEP